MLEVWDVTTLTASHWHYLTHLFKERQLHDIWCKICLSSVWMFAVIHVIKWNRIICSPNWGCSDAVNTCGGSAVWCHVKFSAWRSDMKQLEYETFTPTTGPTMATARNDIFHFQSDLMNDRNTDSQSESSESTETTPVIITPVLPEATF